MTDSGVRVAHDFRVGGPAVSAGTTMAADSVSPFATRNYDLVDEYRLIINPILVGSGKRLFRGDNDRKMLRLADSTISSTGVVIATYDTVTADRDWGGDPPRRT